MKQKLLLWLVIPFLCLSCKEKGITYKQPVFPVEDTARFELLTPELDYGVTEDIWVTDFYIITFASDSRTHRFCHIYDKQKGTLLGETFMRGRGPGEIEAAYGTFEVRNGAVRYFDFTKNKVLQFHIDSLLMLGSSVICETDGDYFSGERFRGSTDKYNVSLYITSNREENTSGINRLTVKDKEGIIVSENDCYPEEDQSANLANTYYVTISPDGTKCAIAPTWSSVLELYDLPSLHARYYGYFAGQEYDSSTGNIKFTEKTVINHSDIYSTNKKVYLSYGGDVLQLANQSLPVEERKLVCNKLDIFDWDGKPLRRIVTDYRVSKLCVDAEEKNVYAIVEDRLRRKYIARLPL